MTDKDIRASSPGDAKQSENHSGEKEKSIVQVTPYSFGPHSKSIYTAPDISSSIPGFGNVFVPVTEQIEEQGQFEMPTFSGFDIDGSIQNLEALEEDAEEPKDDTPLTDYQRRRAEKEALRREIIERTRNAPLENKYYHEGQPTPTIDDPGKKRVAVYSRVSTKSVNQASSLENQEKFYLKKIDSTPNWELVEIYSDKGISGVNITKREAFQKMLQDAAKGAFDYILCTSVSRFSRNISQCLTAVNQLKSANPKHPVGVFFETENIFTLNPDSTQAFGIHALLAHWESENRSKRMILSMDQRIMIGQYQVVDLYGYRHTRKGELIIQREEAIVFRYIVLNLIIGRSGADIAEELTALGKPTLTGNTIWTSSTISGLLPNERRYGALEARKTICTNYIEKTTEKNNGVRDWAFVPHHHQGIVTKEEITAARMMLSASGMLENGIPELRVIKEGVLRGFVSIRPRWNGLDQDTLIYACLSAYTEEETATLKTEMSLWNGPTDTAEDMTKPCYQTTPGVKVLNDDSPRLTIRKKCIALNRQCNRQLECEWIEFLYHPIRHLLIIREGSPEDPNSIRVDSTGKYLLCAESTAFSKALYGSLSWNAEHDYCFKGIGRQRGKAKALIFALDAPMISTSDDAHPKKRSASEMTTPNDVSAIYINHAKEDAAMNRWMNGLRGRNQMLNQRQVMQVMGESDLTTPGSAILNPLVGSIGTREDMISEIQELQDAM